MKLGGIIAILLSTSIPFATGCPKDEDLFPCFCDWTGLEGRQYSITRIYCTELNNNQDLVKAATSLIGVGGITSFDIDDCVFNFIPSNTFKGTKLPEITIKKSSFMGLTDTDIAFEGLEDSLETLTIEDCTFMNEWSWSIFRNLKKLRKISIEKLDLESIEYLGEINMTNLNDISFVSNRISFIHPDAFFNCRNLKVLKLGHNEISQMKRSMFPNPALELTIIDLSYNKINQLPDDMFTKMPKIVQISIAHNHILVLKEGIFKEQWNKLDLFDATGNELSCDCRISWILNYKRPKAFWAVCAQPQELKGKDLSSLQAKNLFCVK